MMFISLGTMKRFRKLFLNFEKNLFDREKIFAFFIRKSFKTVCFIPNQNKFLINLPTYRPTPSPAPTTTTTTTKSQWWPSNLDHENEPFELGYWSLISKENIHFKKKI